MTDRTSSPATTGDLLRRLERYVDEARTAPGRMQLARLLMTAAASASTHGHPFLATDLSDRAANAIAAEQAGFAISYGLGQGATMVAAAWGVFIWKEFKDAPEGTGRLLGAMFGLFIVGLGMIIAARLV